MKRTTTLVGLGILLYTLGLNAEPQPKALSSISALSIPTAFEPNRGQAPKQFDFAAQGFGYSVGISATHAGLALSSGTGAPSTIFLNLLGANARSQPQPLDRLRQTSSYFMGERSITGVPTFAKLKYAGIWPGIDIVYYGNNQKLEYDFVVSPGGDLKSIHLRFEGLKSIKRSAAGDLILQTASNQLTQLIPVAYQMRGSERVPITAKYKLLADGSIRIAVGKYDHSKELVIDPVLVYSKSPYAFARDAAAVTTDAAGNSYVVGTTVPVPVTPQPTPVFNTVYVVKFANTGTMLAQTSLAASDGNVFGTGVAVDSAQNAYLTGYTDSATGFTFSGANTFQSASGGGSDAFLAKINVGFTAVLYATYLGGSGTDQATGIAVDANGVAYISGLTTSTNFPVASPPAGQNGFIFALDTTKTGAASKVYGLVVGGSGNLDAATGVSVDSNSNAYVSGITNSSNFLPVTATGYQTTKSNTNTDGFLLKLNASGTPTWSTFFAFGPMNAVAQSGGRFAYVTGQTTGSIPTTASGYQLTGGPNHAFFADFDTSANGAGALAYSSYLRGSSTDMGTAIAAAPNGFAMIVGSTSSPDFPLVGTPAIQPTYIGGMRNTDAFLSFITPLQSGVPSLVYSTFVGTGNTIGTGIASNLYNEAVMTATTYDNSGNPNGGLTLKVGAQIWDTTFFVTQLYIDLLDRAPDSGGLAFWTGLITNGSQTRAQVAGSFFNSVEFSQGGLTLIKYYIAVLGRDPDFGGWKYWFDQVNIQQVSLNTVLNNFLASPEFQNTYGSLSNDAFVNLVYQNVLGRMPDQAGHDYWLGQLNSGQLTRAGMMAGFINSNEFNTRVRARAFANLLYMGFLRRTADAGGLAFWTGILADPNQLPATINGFITSQEYVARF